MSRREQIENIIIGTLLNSDNQNNYYENVKFCVTADMFTDDRRKEIFNIVAEMNVKGLTRTWPDAIFDFQEHKTSKELLAYMVELATDWFFYAKKVEYNERIFWTDSSPHKHFTNVTFDDYVSRFIKIAFEDDSKR